MGDGKAPRFTPVRSHGGLDGVVLSGLDPDGLSGEGDVGVATGRRRPKGFDTSDGSWHLS